MNLLKVTFQLSLTNTAKPETCIHPSCWLFPSAFLFLQGRWVIHCNVCISVFVYLFIYFPPHTPSLQPSYVHLREEALPQCWDQWTAVLCSASAGSYLEALQVGRISDEQRERGKASIHYLFPHLTLAAGSSTHFYLFKEYWCGVNSLKGLILGA